MQSKNLIYKNGHFYDSLDGKRIGIKDNAKVCIVATDKDFIPFSPAGTYPLEIKDSKTQENELKSDKAISQYKLIKRKGGLLYFCIKHSQNGLEIHHEFEVELLEDLYMFLKNDWKIQEGKLHDCACVLKNTLTNSIDFFEEVYAQSLNEIYKNTYVHYFGNEGNPACNAIDRFYEKPSTPDLSLRHYRKFANLLKSERN